MKQKFKGFFRSLFKNKKIFIPLGVLIFGVIVIIMIGLRTEGNSGPKAKNNNTNQKGKTNSNTVSSNNSKTKKNNNNQKSQKPNSSNRPTAANLSSAISSAQKRGAITAEQAKLLEEKNIEIKKFSESIKDKDDSELMQITSKKRSELRKWASQNKLPDNFIYIIMRANGI